MADDPTPPPPPRYSLFNAEFTDATGKVHKVVLLLDQQTGAVTKKYG